MVVNRLGELSSAERKPFAAQITDISADLKEAMSRRKVREREREREREMYINV